MAGDSKGQAVLGADPSSSSLSLVLSRVRLMVGHELCPTGAWAALCDITAGICRVMDAVSSPYFS